MKIISKIKIHPFFYLFCIICILTGYFKIYLIISFIIFFHEIGHILVSQYYKWNIKKIVILPFGGITIFKEHINKRIKEEFLIAIAGPIFQTFLFVIKNPLFFKINLFLLIFNLLPIFPLDGSKILNLLFNKMISFKYSHIFSIYISFLVLLLVFVKNSFNLVLLIIFLFLFIKTLKERINHKYIFNKFMFERYLYKFNFKKSSIINNPKQMKRDYKHIFHIKNKYILEKDFLSNLFDNS